MNKVAEYYRSELKEVLHCLHPGMSDDIIERLMEARDKVAEKLSSSPLHAGGATSSVPPAVLTSE